MGPILFTVDGRKLIEPLEAFLPLIDSDQPDATEAKITLGDLRKITDLIPKEVIHKITSENNSKYHKPSRRTRSLKRTTSK